jgi:hypothetical protein
MIAAAFFPFLDAGAFLANLAMTGFFDFFGVLGPASLVCIKETTSSWRWRLYSAFSLAWLRQNSQSNKQKLNLLNTD